jgi:hypothetical protein
MLLLHRRRDTHIRGAYPFTLWSVAFMQYDTYDGSRLIISLHTFRCMEDVACAEVWPMRKLELPAPVPAVDVASSVAPAATHHARTLAREAAHFGARKNVHTPAPAPAPAPVPSTTDPDPRRSTARCPREERSHIRAGAELPVPASYVRGGDGTKYSGARAIFERTSQPTSTPALATYLAPLRWQAAEKKEPVSGLGLIGPPAAELHWQ